MNDAIKVYVVDYGRASLYMRYVCPLKNKQVVKSTKTSDPKLAAKRAAVWEDELKSGRYKPASKVTWEEFTTRYDEEVLPALAEGSQNKAWAVFNSVAACFNPTLLSDVTAERLSQWQQHLRTEKLADSTIRTHVGSLRAALNWAHEVGMLPEVPKLRNPLRGKTGKVMKGRAVTAEEYERMLAAVVKTVGATRAPQWTRFLNWLWFSGLRLSEALALTWDGKGMVPDMSGKRVILHIPEAAQKARREERHPLAPEAAEMLLAVPEDRRTGFVFDITGRDGARPKTPVASRIVTAIGRRAGVKVNDAGRKGVAAVKWASAHDLRRAYGTRWATKVMPPVLQQLMRHSNIQTTMRYYVTKNAEATADLLYDVLGIDSGISDRKAANHQDKQAAESESENVLAERR